MKEWPPNQQPDLSICPQHFCFFWDEKGDLKAPGFYKSPEEALNHFVKITKSQCGFQYGCCSRNKAVNGIKDFYEPCEPRLEKAGLPDFYFNPPEWHQSAEKKPIYDEYFGIK